MHIQYSVSHQQTKMAVSFFERLSVEQLQARFASEFLS